MSLILKKLFKINDIQLVHLLVVCYLVNLQDAWCNNKDNFTINLILIPLASSQHNPYDIHIPIVVYSTRASPNRG